MHCCAETDWSRFAISSQKVSVDPVAAFRSRALSLAPTRRQLPDYRMEGPGDKTGDPRVSGYHQRPLRRHFMCDAATY